MPANGSNLSRTIGISQCMAQKEADVCKIYSMIKKECFTTE